jgi:hypothetical protein
MILAASQRKVLVEYPRVPSGAQYRRRFLVMRSIRERNIAQFLLKVSAVKSSISRSFRRSSHCSSHQIFAHSHLIREPPKIVTELYEEFAKLSKSEVMHFRKLQQHKKHPSTTKLPCHLIQMTISAATPKQVHNIDSDGVGLRRIRKIILDHLSKKEAREPLSKGQTNIIREGARQAKATVTAEAYTHSSLHIACAMAVIPTTAQRLPLIPRV